MQITLIDLLIAWFSKIWERLDALKKDNKMVLQMYVLGVISLILIYPSIYLISWVYGVDIMDIHNFRFYLAIMIFGIFMYSAGGAVGIYVYREEQNKRGKKQ